MCECERKGMIKMKSYYPEGYLVDTMQNKKALTSPSALAEACAKGDVLEAAAVVCDAEHNLIVNLGCMRGIIPRNEGAIGIQSGQVRDIALISRVGKPVCFTVSAITSDSAGTSYALLSRRTAQEKCRRNYISSLHPGDIITAKITHLENFGAFCDIGCGCIALLPIDTISVSRISHPKDRFSCGDEIKVIVRSIDENGRITLSFKELLGTWEENAANFVQGETVSGIVRSVEEYGVFVELAPNLAGLAEPRVGVKVGQHASVYIKSLLPDKMKVKLIIIDSFEKEYTKSPTIYFYNGDHMDYWKYSPDTALKTVATEFTIKV